MQHVTLHIYKALHQVAQNCFQGSLLIHASFIESNNSTFQTLFKVPISDTHLKFSSITDGLK